VDVLIPGVGPRPPCALTSPSDVRALLQRMDFKPSRVLGQNFLIDGNILRIMLDAAGLQPADHVLEIGPGLGC
jgi:16S rRNA (adenine1518-N6/adenine1519-N6)-dimethyltransferase